MLEKKFSRDAVGWEGTQDMYSVLTVLVDWPKEARENSKNEYALKMRDTFCVLWTVSFSRQFNCIWMDRNTEWCRTLKSVPYIRDHIETLKQHIFRHNRSVNYRPTPEKDRILETHLLDMTSFVDDFSKSSIFASGINPEDLIICRTPCKMSVCRLHTL